jgi:hypothetical protein
MTICQTLKTALFIFHDWWKHGPPVQYTFVEYICGVIISTYDISNIIWKLSLIDSKKQKYYKQKHLWKSGSLSNLRVKLMINWLLNT